MSTACTRSACCTRNDEACYSGSSSLPVRSGFGVAMSPSSKSSSSDGGGGGFFGLSSVFFGGSFGLYNNVPGLGVLWRPFRARNGRDFMWNSGVFGVNTGHAQQQACNRQPCCPQRHSHGDFGRTLRDQLGQ